MKEKKEKKRRREIVVVIEEIKKIDCTDKHCAGCEHQRRESGVLQGKPGYINSWLDVKCNVFNERLANLWDEERDNPIVRCKECLAAERRR